MARAGIRSFGIAACALLALGATCRRESSPPPRGAAAQDAGSGVVPDAGSAPGAVAPAAGRLRLLGLISPHAGYEFSGAVAAWGYKQLEGAGRAEPAPALAETVSAYPAQVAGGFYPADPAELRAQVEGFLGAAEQRADFDVGPIRTVIVLAPSHHYPFSGAVVLAEDAYETPLGRVPVDTALRAKFIEAAGSDAVVDSQYFRREHAMEDQLPFLQVVLPGAAVLPVLVGDAPVDQLERLGHAVAGLIRERPDVFLVASSDMSHFHPYDEAVSADERTLAALTSLDLATFDGTGSGHVQECPTGECVDGMCGYHPVRVALTALRELAGAQAQVIRLRYANSGDVTPERERVVGYGSLALVQAETGDDPAAGSAAGGAEGAMYTREERQALIDIAKAAVGAAVRGEAYAPPEPSAESLRRDGAAFVTLKEHGELRGCIGQVLAREPLYRCVADVAHSAAVEDPRFNPVEASELGELTYEISVLTPPEVVTDPTTIVVGRDGLIMTRGGRRGLLLPQVPGEQGWSREQFLDGTCRKAGLPTGCWRDPGTRIERFQAIVWGESLDDELD